MRRKNDILFIAIGSLICSAVCGYYVRNRKADSLETKEDKMIFYLSALAVLSIVMSLAVIAGIGKEIIEEQGMNKKILKPLTSEKK